MLPVQEIFAFPLRLPAGMAFAQKGLPIVDISTGILLIPSLDDAVTDAVASVLFDAGVNIQVAREQAVPSQRNWIVDLLIRWCDEEELDLILTIGGTYPAPGPSAAEIVPEATIDATERLLPGFSEIMRMAAQEETPLALLDRGVVGIRGRTLIINLPAGAQPAALFLEPVADLIDAVLAHLRVEPGAPTIAAELTAHALPGEADADAMGSALSTGGLDAAEFADFLQRGDDERTDHGST